MIAPSADYAAPVAAWREHLFAQTGYLKKMERWALLEAACVYIHDTAAKQGQPERLERAFRLTAALAEEKQRVHALCAVLVQIAMEDLGTQADPTFLQPTFGEAH